MKPVTKDDLKREIDNLPESVLARLHKFIGSLKKRKKKDEAFPTFNLNGKFDEINVRSEAYE